MAVIPLFAFRRGERLAAEVAKSAMLEALFIINAHVEWRVLANSLKVVASKLEQAEDAVHIRVVASVKLELMLGRHVEA